MGERTRRNSDIQLCRHIKLTVMEADEAVDVRDGRMNRSGSKDQTLPNSGT